MFENFDLEKAWPYLIFSQMASSLGQGVQSISAGVRGQQTQMPQNPMLTLFPLMQKRAEDKKRGEALARIKQMPGVTPEQASFMSDMADLGIEGPFNQFAKAQFGDEEDKLLNTAKGVYSSKLKGIIPGTEDSKTKLKEVGGKLYDEATGQWIIPPDVGSGDDKFKHWKDASGNDVYGWVNEKTQQIRPFSKSPPQVPGYLSQGGQVYETRNPLDPLIGSLERETGVPAGLGRALIMSESSGDTNAQGGAGDSGLTQIIPSTARAKAKQMGITALEGMSDPEVTAYLKRNDYLNMKLGLSHYSDLLRKYKGDESLALIEWNAGADDVEKYLKAGRDENVLKFPTRSLMANYDRNKGVMLPGKPLTPDIQLVPNDRGELVRYDKRTNEYTPTGINAKNVKKETIAQINGSLDLIGKAKSAILKDPGVVGSYGKLRAIAEGVRGQYQTGAPQPARDFDHTIESLRSMNLPALLNESGRSISDQDRKRVEKILSGTGWLDTPSDAIRDLDFLTELLTRASTFEGPSVTTPKAPQGNVKPESPSTTPIVDKDYRSKLEYTAKKYGITVEEVERRLKAKQINP